MCVARIPAYVAPALSIGSIPLTTAEGMTAVFGKIVAFAYLFAIEAIIAIEVIILNGVFS